jgi:hypothetical protein
LIRFVAADARAEGVAPAFLRVSAMIGASGSKTEFFWGAARGKRARASKARQRAKLASMSDHCAAGIARPPGKKKGPRRCRSPIL